MHSVGKERVDAFIADLRESCKTDWHDAFPEIDVSAVPPGPNPGPCVPYTPPKTR